MMPAGSLSTGPRDVAKRLTTIVVLTLVLVGCSALATPAPGPVIRPAPSAAPPSTPTSDNLAQGKPATASAFLPDQPPSAAVDGDPETIWNSGGLPTQWIEIDFGSVFDIERVILLTAQTPDGPTIHQVWGRGESGDYRQFHEFRGSTADGLTLDVSPVSYWSGIRYLKIETTESPSWVAWREIAVFGKLAALAAVDEPFSRGMTLIWMRP